VMTALFGSSPSSQRASQGSGNVEAVIDDLDGDQDVVLLSQDETTLRHGYPWVLSYGPPWAHYLGGYQDRLLGGPWDYSACATRHLMAWGARTTMEKYADRKLYMSCTV
jgi:hypothetical protein